MNPYDGLPDEALIARLRQGEEKISDYLLEKYKGLVKQRARAMFLVGGDNDDLIQEGMIGLFKAIRDYQSDKAASFQTFARLCVERQMYSAIQLSNRKKNLPLNSSVSLEQEEAERQTTSWAENPEHILIDQENVEALRREITRKLSPMENRVLQCYLEGMGYVKIGELMGKSPKSIDNAIQRIRTKIKR